MLSHRWSQVKGLLWNYLIYAIPFAVFHLIHFGKLPFANRYYTSFIFLYSFAWLISATIARKIVYTDNKSSLGEIKSLTLSFIIMIGIYSAFNLFGADAYHSRSVFILSAASGFAIEMIFAIRSAGLRSYFRGFKDLSFTRFVMELCVFVVIIGTQYLFYPPSISGLPRIDYILIIFFVWMLSGFMSGLYYNLRAVNVIYLLIWQILKNGIYFFLLSSFVVFYLTPDILPQFRFLHTIIIYSISALIVDIVIYLNLKPMQSDEVDSTTTKAPELADDPLDNIMKVNQDKYYFPNTERINYTFESKLRNIFLRNYPAVFSFIESSLELQSIDADLAIAIRTNDIYNIEVMPDEYISFFCNLQDLNNIRYLNKYFIEVNNKLKDGGIFIGALEPAHLRFRHFKQSYPFYLGRILYFIEFIWTRVFPKLPITKSIYFAITKGKNRAISLAESLGRLYYCGFEVIAIKEIDQKVFFIAHKVSHPREDKNPSYGPLFKMRRIGKDGKIILVYKLRTMHPYSEYLQKFVYEHNKLEEGGKFHQDFRITSWGRFFRKIWVDELPMILNWLKGDLKLVGVRPISQHYLSLYGEEVRERRKNYKPGLVPPFYVDLPTTLEEIIQSEVNYMNAYDVSPIKTDIKYFFKSFYNILIKSARSK